MGQPKQGRQLSLHFDMPKPSPGSPVDSAVVSKVNLVSLSSFRAGKTRQQLSDQLRRSGLLELKVAEA